MPGNHDTVLLGSINHPDGPHRNTGKTTMAMTGVPTLASLSVIMALRPLVWAPLMQVQLLWQAVPAWKNERRV